MKFYTYDDVKTKLKGKNLIVLLGKSEGEYWGLFQDKEIKIKNEYFDIEKYDFIVCARVLSRKGNYFIPVGYSNESEWLKQEFSKIEWLD
ncbi:hypothetical protein ACV3OB_16060 [Clostridium perfringens]|uniref:hypothetical protein n=1 Tax=Clostridium perfringens TaxID=1502 RepID=UPI000D8AC7C1|nr:hypothetical protein [Clostridium perfringens]EGT4141293.1 hypothetical protein [Clostridium perfringens]ELC8368309.1 hypothetical protein [Clostridium perfringens]MCX0404515.1 hypothetical protein [Clostridium perfringens]PWX25724.1 hypothetical protein CYK95_12615 [Clostridium perfringens]